MRTLRIFVVDDGRDLAKSLGLFVELKKPFGSGESLRAVEPPSRAREE
jgi:hypothetical protein